MRLGLPGHTEPQLVEQEAPMSVNSYADDLSSAVHCALETTHAIAVCPFHLDVTIRVGDDAAETHAVLRAKKLVKSDGTSWNGEVLGTEFARQLGKAADRYCPRCVPPGGSWASCEDQFTSRFRRELSGQRRHRLRSNRNLPARAAAISSRLKRRSCAALAPAWTILGSAWSEALSGEPKSRWS